MQHFLSLTEHSAQDILHLLDLALTIKQDFKMGSGKPLLQGKTLAMVFQKPSLRTRVSFDMAMIQLGGQALYLSPQEIQLGKRESVADVSRVLSRYVDGIMARVFAHDDILELAKYASVPVINGLSDLNHPCQGLADLLTIVEHNGSVQGQRIVFIGDGNNVARTLMFGAALLGADFVAASPEAYVLADNDIKLARQYAESSGGKVTLIGDPMKAVKGANVIYTDTWTSMGQEMEAEERRKSFARYQVNESLVSLSAKDCIVMHCLPAHRGEELTDQVADGPNSVIFDQAENRLHAQKAILVALMG
ncbi:MAG: ornithine carbamoyltransferase [Chloroflexota bacterium]